MPMPNIKAILGEPAAPLNIYIKEKHRDALRQEAQDQGHGSIARIVRDILDEHFKETVK